MVKKETIVTFRVDPELCAELERITSKEKVSTSCLIRAALKKFAQEYENRK